MKYGVVAGIFIALFLATVLFQAAEVSAQFLRPTPSSQPSSQAPSSSSSSTSFLPDFIRDSSLLRIFRGENLESSVVAETIKWFFLFLIIFLVYAGMLYANFPHQAGLRLGIAIIVGFLATLFITRDEIISAMLSYTALGTTLIVFFPVIIMGFITFAVSISVAPFGILLQRIMWVIYSIYLFIQSLGLLLIRWIVPAGAPQDVLDKLTAESPNLFKLFNFFFGADYFKEAAATGSNTILVILLIVSVVVFWIFVVKNHALVLWLSKEMRQADIDRYKDVVERAKLSRETDASLTRSRSS